MFRLCFSRPYGRCFFTANLFAFFFAVRGLICNELAARETGCPPVALFETLIIKYGSLPEGIVLEGDAWGLSRITSARYDWGGNRLTFNGKIQYPLPIPRAEVRELIDAFIKDDRLGVSLSGKKEIVYGGIDRKGTIATKLLALDKFFEAIVFGRKEELKGIELPGNFKPSSAVNRQTPAAVCFQFLDFRFGELDLNLYLISCDLYISLVPLLPQKAEDGGHIPDMAALKAGQVEPSDLNNVRQIQGNLSEYLKLPLVVRVKQLGEVAALIRFLARSNIDLLDLAASMKKE